ncbi:MAG: peroxiredoxin-like family protein [Chloroflexota bacterium]
MTADVTTDPTLEAQISAFMRERASVSTAPAPSAGTAARVQQLEMLIQTQAAEKSLQVGQIAPDFSLPNVDGSAVNLQTLLENGPVVVTFYRGDWCPFCNLTLRAYEHILPQIQALGGTLLAISPQTPDYSILTVEHKALTYPVLSDVGNHTARAYGIVFTVPEVVRPYSANLEQYNGDGSWEMPMAATYVIDQNSKVRFASVNPDPTKRAEPNAILEALKKL